jgi:hypothetical protein
MLHIKCQEHFQATKLFAESIGKEKEFTEVLNRLNNLGDVIELYKDFADHSFTFVAFYNGKRSIEGGLIYHSPEADKTNYSVTLTPTIGWRIHT